MTTARILAASALSFICMGIANFAIAGTITTYGSVTAMDNVDQFVNVIGEAGFDEATSGSVAADTYASLGMTLHSGSLSSVLPGVTALGSGNLPARSTTYVSSSYFPSPQGGGSVSGTAAYIYGPIATFDPEDNVTQFGLTFSRNGTQYITAWDEFGDLIGQVRWQPSNDSAFVGLDTGGIPIGMIAVGNDDVWNGVTFSAGGSTTIYDNLIWGTTIVADVPEPASMAVWACLGVGLITLRRIRRCKR